MLFTATDDVSDCMFVANNINVIVMDSFHYRL